MLMSSRRQGAPSDSATASATDLARHAADMARADAERARIAVASQIEVSRMRAEAARQAKTDRHNAKVVAWMARRSERRKRRRVLVARLRPLVPLAVVNSTAMYGQVAAGYEYLTPAGTPAAAKLGVAVLVAAAAEIIALYVGWHAHDALLRSDSRTAGRLRRASYLIAAVIGAVNYSHFAGPHLAPTWAAIVFGLMSTLSPWLWGLHSRRAQHVQLSAEGRADTAGAVFSGERIRAFPIRSWKARRWSIDHGVSDPVTAWEGFRASQQEEGCTCQVKALPSVPSAAELAGMTTKDRNDAARRTYLAAVAAGIPVTPRLLASAYGLSRRWASDRIREARADRTEN